MAIQKSQKCVIAGFLLFLIIQETLANYGEVNLTEKLFTSYKKNIRPQISLKLPMKIVTSVSFFQLLRIDEKEEVMTFSVWVRMNWNDSRLTWDPANFESIASLNVDVQNLWHPDIHLFDSIESGVFFPSVSEGDLGFRAKISSDGLISYSRPMILKTSCTMSIADYPYDSQQCLLTVGSWAHDKNMIDITEAENVIDMDNYTPSEGWNITSTTVTKSSVKFNCCKDPFSVLVFSLTMKRASLFYSINYVLPAVNLVFLSLLMFTVPPEVGKRMECGINLLLCIAVYLILVNAKVPSTSLAFPVISKFYGCAIFILVIGMYCTTSVYAYYFHDPTGRGIYLMNDRFKAIVLYWLARIFLFQHGYRKGPDGKFVPVSSLSWSNESFHSNKQIPKEHPEVAASPRTLQTSVASNESSSKSERDKEILTNTGIKQQERNDSGFQENDKASSRYGSRSSETVSSRSIILKSSRVTPEGEDISTRRNQFGKKRSKSEGIKRGGRNKEKLTDSLDNDKEQGRPCSVDSGKPSSPDKDKSQNKHELSSPIVKKSSDSLWSSFSSNSCSSLSSLSPEMPAHVLQESSLPVLREVTSQSMEIIEELLKEIGSDDEDYVEFDVHTEDEIPAVKDKNNIHETPHDSGICMDDLADVIEDQSRRGLSDEEWRKAARVFNRIFIIVLILSIVISAIACFVV